MNTNFDIKKCKVLKDSFFGNISGFEPISNMFSEAKAQTISFQHIGFYYSVLKESLSACMEGRYSCFDAHTSATCCHGVALLALSLVGEISLQDMEEIKKGLDEKLIASQNLNPNLQVPTALMWLCRLYILHMVKAPDANRGYLTDYMKLKNFFPLSNRFYSHLTKALQKQVANLVADRYRFYMESLPPYAVAHGLPVNLWGKYACDPHKRMSSNGVIYVSNLFSMRITLAYLSYNCCYISLINDVMDENNNPLYRYCSLFKGDGNGGVSFISCNQSDLHLPALDDRTPVFVLGGVAYLQDFNKEKFLAEMKLWQSRLLELVLACDIWYPQFPSVTGDAAFDHSAIIPQESQLQDTLNFFSKIEGVKADDPSLCCLAHIYPASLKEIIVEHNADQPTLPWSFLPAHIRCNHVSLANSFLADQ